MDAHGVFWGLLLPRPFLLGQGGHAHLTRGGGCGGGHRPAGGGVKLPIDLPARRGCGLVRGSAPLPAPPAQFLALLAPWGPVPGSPWLTGPAGRAWVTQFWVPPPASRRPRPVIQKLAVPRRPQEGSWPPRSAGASHQRMETARLLRGQWRAGAGAWGCSPRSLWPRCFMFNVLFRVSFRLTEVAKVSPRQGVGVRAHNPSSSGS